MSKTYKTSKSAKHRRDVILHLKRRTPSHDKELTELNDLIPKLKEQEKAARDAKENAKKAKKEADKARKLAEAEKQRDINYENAIKEKINELNNDCFPKVSDEWKDSLMRFFYSKSMMKPKSGKLESRFSKHQLVALTYILFSYSQNAGYDIVLKIIESQIKISEFHNNYVGGNIHSVGAELCPFLTGKQLERLVNVVSPNSNGVGRLEVLLRILLVDCTKVNGGADINFKDRSKDIEVKLGVYANGGRAAGHKKLDPSIAELNISKNIQKKYGMTFNHPVYIDGWMTKTVNELLKVDSIENILKIYAAGRINGWNIKEISDGVKEFFISDIVKNAQKFLINDKFDENSEDMFNGTHDWFTYYTIEKFPNILFATEVKDSKYDVLFRMFNESDYNTPEKIINLCLNNKVGFCGKLKKGTGYDSVVHFYGIF